MAKHPSSSIELALLGFLRTSPKHGYAIHQDLSDPAGLGPVWQIKLSQLYALLGKLEDAGYISASKEFRANTPPRNLFRMTDEGEKAFLTWVSSPVRHGRSLRLEFLIKLYFSRLEGGRAAEDLVTAQRVQCQEWLEVEREILAEEISSGRRYSILVREFRLGQIRSMLSWLDRCEEVVSRES